MKFRLWKNHPKSCQQKRTDPRSELQFPRPRPTSLHHRTAATSSFFLSCSAPWFSDSSSSTLPFYFPQMAIHLPHLTQGISQPLWFWFLSSAPLLFFIVIIISVIPVKSRCLLCFNHHLYVVNSPLPLQPYTYCKEKLMNFGVRQAWGEISALLCTTCET